MIAIVTPKTPTAYRPTPAIWRGVAAKSPNISITITTGKAAPRAGPSMA